MTVELEIQFIGSPENPESPLNIPHADAESMIQEAADYAQRIAHHGLQQVQKVLISPKLGDDIQKWNSASGKAFLLYFGLTIKQMRFSNSKPTRNPLFHYNKVEERLETLVDRLRSDILIKVRPLTGSQAALCKGGKRGAYQNGWLANRTIHLCPKWFNNDLEERARILLHELAHGIGGLGTFDQKIHLSGSPSQAIENLPTIHGSIKVRGDIATRMLAKDSPGKASINPENYEHFFRYIIRRHSSITKNWKGVRPNMSAALVHPNGKAFFFYRRTYLRYDFDTRTVDKEGVIGKDGWFGLKPPFDAAILHPNGKAYFFHGKKYQRYDFKSEPEGRDKTGVIGRDGWKGLRKNIDAAVMHPVNGKAYFFSNLFYRRFDFAPDKVDKLGILKGSGGSKIGSLDYKTAWSGLFGHFDAALINPNNDKGYFFVGNRYFRYNFDDNKVENESVFIN